MALLTNEKNEAKTPEQLAKEALESTKPQPMTITDVDDLIKVARYNNRDIIQVRGEKYWDKNKTELMSDTLSKLITDRAKALTKYIDKKEADASMEYFRLLRSKGVGIEEAQKMAGINL